MKEEAKKKPKKKARTEVNDEVVKAWDKAQGLLIDWFEEVIGDDDLLEQLKEIRAQRDLLLP